MAQLTLFHSIAVIIYSNNEFSPVIFASFFFPLELFLFAKWLKHSASSNLGSEITVLKS